MATMSITPPIVIPHLVGALAISKEDERRLRNRATIMMIAPSSMATVTTTTTLAAMTMVLSRGSLDGVSCGDTITWMHRMSTKITKITFCADLVL